MDIQEKIIQLLHDEYYDIDGLDCKQKWLAPIADQILSLIRQEIEEAIPKEKHFINEGSQTEETGSWNNKNSYNQALSDIRAALKERGIL